jgi:hypothetical protein
LNASKKRIVDIVNESKKVVKEKKDAKKNYKQQAGRPRREVLPKFEIFL